MSFQPAPIALATEAETAALAARIAPVLQAGDTLLLSGPIGAGKSAFARALIRTRLHDPLAEVPSPTFTLVQTYDAGDTDIWHTDLYRLHGPDEALELGLDLAFDTAICLVEWPDRLGAMTPQDALHLAFMAGPAGHEVMLSGPDSWADRLAGCLG
jgi:tRNA threonylcarbamoyladenosine biosynthesis protein TsaE